MVLMKLEDNIAAITRKMTIFTLLRDVNNSSYVLGCILDTG